MKILDVFPSRLCAVLCIIYILAFCAYPALPASRTSTDIFLWWSTFHSALGLALAFTWRKDMGTSPVLLGLLFLLPRFLVFPMMPWLSDDVYRYLWDGTVLVHGYNPYAYTPNAESLAHLQGPLYELMDYKNIPTVYPPFAQLAFAGATSIGALFGSSWHYAYFVWKVLLLLSEAIGLYFIAKLLQKLSLPLSGIALYVCLPLPVIELVGQAHMDGLLLAPLGLLVYTCFCVFANCHSNNEQPRLPNHILPIGIGLLVGALFLLKLTPVVVVLPLLRQRVVHRGILLATAACTVFFLFTPFLSQPHALTYFMTTAHSYTATLQFNGVVLYCVISVLRAFDVQKWWLLAPSILSLLRLVVTALCGLWSAILTPQTLYNRLLWTLLAVTLLAGKVHTWYVVPLLLLNTITGSWWLPVFASATLLTYTIYSTPQAQEAYALEYLLWAGGAAFLLCEWWYKRRKQVHYR